MEPGYVFVNAVVNTFTSNYIFLFLTAALISIGITIYNYYRYSTYVLLSILLDLVHTYLYRDMNQVRAGIAAAIGLFLIAQIHNREHLKSYGTLLLSGLFHVASLSLVIPLCNELFPDHSEKGHSFILAFIESGDHRYWKDTRKASAHFWLFIRKNRRLCFGSILTGAALKLYDPTTLRIYASCSSSSYTGTGSRHIISYFETFRCVPRCQRIVETRVF